MKGHVMKHLQPITPVRVAAAQSRLRALLCHSGQLAGAIGIVILLLSWGYSVDTAADAEDALYLAGLQAGREAGRQEMAESVGAAWKQGHAQGRREAAAEGLRCTRGAAEQVVARSVTRGVHQ